MDVPLPDPKIEAADVAAEPQRSDAPRAVIRGESYEPSTKAAFTDWLNVSFPISSSADPVKEFVRAFSECTDGVFGGLTDRGRGLHGYSRSFEFDRGKALFAIGGQRSTGFISISGDGCALIRDWSKITSLFRDRLCGRITRWDGAVDDFEGQHSVDLAVELWRLGGFATGGNRPSCTQAGNWIEPDGRGRTLYVGKRKNGKLARIYEKGMQLGARFHPWVRWEIEYRNVDRHIPWDVLAEPGNYVAGAFPCLSWVSQQASRVRTVKTQDAISYERLTHCGSVQYGALINVMLEREGSAERVVELLRRVGVPNRLRGTDDVLRFRGGDDAFQGG